MTLRGNHFRAAAGKVQNRDICRLKPFEDLVDSFCGDDFLATRTGIHVAVATGKVTEFTDIKLQDFRLAARQGHVMRLESFAKG